ncbi:cysteine-rich receptor-like protein kinase, partial [Trifolium pratense]
MKIMSFNMTGWGDAAKCRRLSSLLKKGAFDMCFLQETKKLSFNDAMIQSLWGHNEVNWLAKEASGLSGGLLCIWNKNLFSFVYSFTGDGFLGVCVEWKEGLLYLVNIYSPCSLSGKRKLWKDLLDFKANNVSGEWCLGGDFNAISKRGERTGRGYAGSLTERTDFNSFMEAMEVVDIPVLGKQFTWCKSDCTAMSRLDRFLLSDGFILKGGITNQWVGDRDISDHCPIWLECSNRNWGPKPFKFNNCWIDHPGFFDFVKQTWASTSVNGSKVFILKEKLKRLKEALKLWNKDVFGFKDLSIDNTVKELNEVEDLIAKGDVDPLTLNSKEMVTKFWEQIRSKESLLIQKSRTKWIQEGDANSRFFHSSIKGRRRRNQIVKIKKEAVWLEGVEAIKQETKDHFSKHLSEEWSSRPFLQGINFKSLSNEDNDLLLAPFDESEVKDTIWSCDGNKSPGPDGFNLNFFKACWVIVKFDVMNFLEEFHAKARLPKAVTASFLTLIPKKDHPQDLFDFRPICLIGSLYKILSKILANRLKRVLGKLISNGQSAFLPHRQIFDGVVVLNEVIDLAKRRKDKCMFFKVDFERAYDSVSWGFLDRMMTLMGFSAEWMSWMRACIFESSMSILVNGSPTDDFKVGRGLRQGDPLSPFLFLIVAEGLAGMMNKAVDIGKFKGFSINANLQFQLLQFADDTIIMGEGSWENLWTIKSLLRGFELVSGLKINFVKSKLYGVNVDTRLLEAGAVFLSCNTAAIPFKFLGLPVGANPRRRETWKPVVEALTKRLNSWNSRLLSFGGRLSLINSVLASIPLYFFSFYKAPRCVLNSLERIQRNFFWGGGLEERKLCWIKWEQVCLPKEKGGLGVKNLEFFNLALLSKWKWRFLNDNDAIWAALLRFRYGKLSSSVLTSRALGGRDLSSLWWRDIIYKGRDFSDGGFSSNISCRVGNGDNIDFWNFKWFGSQAFYSLFPDLYAKEVNKFATVSERLGREGAASLCSWRWSGLLNETEQQQLLELQGLLAGFILSDTDSDRWWWLPESNGLFSVKSCYSFISSSSQVSLMEANESEALSRLWKSDVPSKINVFGWRLLLNRLPTRLALHRR